MFKQLSNEVEEFKDIENVIESLSQIYNLAKQTDDFELIYQSRLIVSL